MDRLAILSNLAQSALDLWLSFWATEDMGGRGDSQVKAALLLYLQGNGHTGEQEPCMPQRQWPLCSLMRTGRCPGLC